MRERRARANNADYDALRPSAFSDERAGARAPHFHIFETARGRADRGTGQQGGPLEIVPERSAVLTQMGEIGSKFG